MRTTIVGTPELVLKTLRNRSSVPLCLLLLAAGAGWALERADTEFKVFQFPRDQIPCIDGDPSDWTIVPESYAIGADQLEDTVKHTPNDPKDLDCSVKVGWVPGLDRLYFLYEASDDYWDFQRLEVRSDIFEVVVDGDLSGGPLIPGMRTDGKPYPEWDGQTRFQGVQAQNYHIFTPPGDKEWTMVWGCQPWIAELPWANHAYRYDFQQGQPGKLVLEFWITPFDYAPVEGPQRAVVSKLLENELIGLSWSILDYDGGEQYDGFYNLSHVTKMYGDASALVGFRLMPLEARFHQAIEADWSLSVLDSDRHLVAFKDRSYGVIKSWHWDFGDGTTSTEQNPIHQYDTLPPERRCNIVLEVTGPAGKARFCRIWNAVWP